jgi:hypothetical protein
VGFDLKNQWQAQPVAQPLEAVDEAGLLVALTALLPALSLVV